MKRWADRVALGNAQKTVTLGELSKYPIALPSLNEQGALIGKLSSINRTVGIEVKSLEKYQETKKGLMQDLLTGKVSVV
jgi:type I restriction enzyme S subunit